MTKRNYEYFYFLKKNYWWSHRRDSLGILNEANQLERKKYTVPVIFTHRNTKVGSIRSNDKTSFSTDTETN